jgi:hypothetical protein
LLESQRYKKIKKNPSKDTKAFKLFSQGKIPVEVAIKLDIGADETDSNFARIDAIFIF